jgi:type IV secretory pathway TraG/TraD family ATPase VirD4
MPRLLVVDELDALGRCSQMVWALTRGRKRGMAAKIATQAVSQIEKNYDKDAPTVLSMPKTKITYRCSEPKLAEWASKLIGSVERRVERTNLRTDISTRGRDAVSLNEDTRITPLVLPIQIAQLRDFEAYLTFGGRTTRLRPPYSHQLKLQRPYIPRDGGTASALRRRRPPTAAPATSTLPSPPQTPLAEGQDKTISLDIRGNIASDKKFGF